VTPERLCDRIQAMPIGGVEILSRAHFDVVFSREPTLEARKAAAAALARRCKCAAVFLGTDPVFVRFMRH
jgi:hypothetical protein